MPSKGIFISCLGATFVLVYNPKENKWDVLVAVGFDRLLPCDHNSCMIDNLLYWYIGGSLRN